MARWAPQSLLEASAFLGLTKWQPPTATGLEPFPWGCLGDTPGGFPSSKRAVGI